MHPSVSSCGASVFRPRHRRPFRGGITMRNLFAASSQRPSVRAAHPSRRRPASASSAPAAMQPLEGRVLLSAGSLDTTFGGGDGMVTSSGFTITLDAAPLPGGGWVAAGPVSNADDSYDFGVRRYNADGSPDPSFGGGDGL